MQEQLSPDVSMGISSLNILPPRYQMDTSVSAAPMGAAGLIYDMDGKLAWDKIWQGFCDLALAGGRPIGAHCLNLLVLKLK